MNIDNPASGKYNSTLYMQPKRKIYTDLEFIGINK